MPATVPKDEPTRAAPNVFIPRPHQETARDAIRAARGQGRPGFLLGDLTGLGKTLSAWAAIAAMPEDDVLIVCPKGAMPQWRRTIAQSGLAPKRVTVINYERTKALLVPPPTSTKRSTRAKNNELARQGRPKQVWPIVVFDESHRLRNPYAQQTMACRQMADAATFTLYLSATAGQSPHELGYLGRVLGFAAGRPTETLADFRQLMKMLGIGRAKGRWKNWTWEPNERDRGVIADLLYKGPNAIGIRRHPGDIAGWPEVQRELAPTVLTPAERRLYEVTWREFRREFGLLGGGTRRPAGWAADLRFRQKASLLRVAGTVAFAEDLLEAGQQVAVSVAFLETGTALAQALTGRGWRVGQIDGRASAEANETTRIAFQTGMLDVVTFTVTESISLHRNEMPGGHRPRSLIVHDMRYSAIQLQQIEGRCHRDGERAIIYYTFGEDTIEERITATVILRMAAMHGLAGDDAVLQDALTSFLDDEA
ncbi:DEAD/DEAH box helicase [Lichenifustis flavocetrariae]|uniref:DEAD/DEAH box helicase n=1 Tax=Lichenifustis flavocetrariae TaxID=2949735 RepID=A0AA42CLX8_9HYPH|nr:DEAD/DEAH box helicase [Lichenifustis flavocetrariae]MCW6510921.1 DEAD/DEAH box helicase [Lichenifustis flavocetrariae]